MKAHKIILLLILLAQFLFISAKTNIEIIGKIENSSKQTIYLKELIKGKNVIVDSIVLTKNGKFNFNVDIDNQGFYMIQLSNVDPNNVILIILDTNIKDNKLLVFADANTFTTTYDVKGSEECSILKNYIYYMNDYGTKRTQIYSSYSDKSSDQTAKLKAKDEIDLLDKQRLEFRNNFINTNYNKLAVVIVLGQLNINQDLEYFKKIEKGLAISSPNSEFHLSIKSQVKQAEIQKQQQAEIQKQQEKTPSHSLPWQTNLEDAIKMSNETGKPLFLFFTGSDWCGWCIRLQKEVFFKPEFAEWATKSVILVELDFPKRTKLDPKLQQQNQQLAQMLGVRGYPTVWFVTPESSDGKTTFNKLGSQGYVAGGPKTWIAGANKILSNIK
jgi:protein disulfide-isomerase